MMSRRWKGSVPLLGASVLILSACSPAPTPDGSADERDYFDVVLELVETFEANASGVVSVADARIPKEMAESLDGGGDGVVDREEFWAFQQKAARRPYRGPRDRSEISNEREGGFPMNVDPEAVSVADAGLGDDDVVLGVVIEGEARAYPVNYMNGPLNEVVNDTVGGAHIAATW
jgi:hypothetical protein